MLKIRATAPARSRPQATCFAGLRSQRTRKVRLYGTVEPGNAIQLLFTKTNRATVSVAVRNQSVSATVFDLAQTLLAAINSCPDLQGPDGVEAADLWQSWFGSAVFNL